MWDPAFDFINGLAGENDAVDSVAEFTAARLGVPIFIIAGIGTMYLLRRASVERIARTIFPIGAVLALTFLLSRGLRALALWERPFDHDTYDVTQLIGHPSGISFPSNHATAAFATAFAVALFLSRPFGIGVGVLGVLSGASRIFVGVHWSWDILGGLVLAGLCTAVIVTIVRWLEANYEPWRWVHKVPLIGAADARQDR